MSSKDETQLSTLFAASGLSRLGRRFHVKQQMLRLPMQPVN